jgi:hypothetical protein
VPRANREVTLPDGVSLVSHPMVIEAHNRRYEAAVGVPGRGRTHVICGGLRR